MTSSLAKPKTNPSLRSMIVTSAAGPSCPDSVAAISNPPNPAPSTTTRMPRTLPRTSATGSAEVLPRRRDRVSREALVVRADQLGPRLLQPCLVRPYVGQSGRVGARSHGRLLVGDDRGAVGGRARDGVCAGRGRCRLVRRAAAGRESRGDHQRHRGKADVREPAGKHSDTLRRGLRPSRTYIGPVTSLLLDPQRLARAQAATAAAGLDALLISPGPDLRYLTGYDALPLERLTCLVVRPTADPVVVVPRLERP